MGTGTSFLELFGIILNLEIIDIFRLLNVLDASLFVSRIDNCDSRNEEGVGKKTNSRETRFELIWTEE